jgi:hypothetical protein
LSFTEDDNNLTITATYAYNKDEIITKIQTINTDINKKQDKFIVAETSPAGSSRLFDPLSNKFRAINVSSPLSITAPNFNYITISCDAYTQKQVGDKLSNLIGSSPAILDTLQEISNFLIGSETIITSNILTLLSNKANTSDTF